MGESLTPEDYGLGKLVSAHFDIGSVLLLVFLKKTDKETLSCLETFSVLQQDLHLTFTLNFLNSYIIVRNTLNIYI